MRITVVAIGTRGDVQPMLALCLGLKAAGHQIKIIAGANFAEWVSSHGFEFAPSADIEALMNSEKGLAWTESSSNPMKQISAMRDLLNEHRESMYRPIMEHCTSGDLIIGSFVAQAFVQSISEKTGIPYIDALLQPQTPTRSGAASLNAITARRDSILNRWMGDFAERILFSVIKEANNEFRTQYLKLPLHTAKTYIRAKLDAPIVFGFSRHVVPPAPDWPRRTVVSGYWFLDEGTGWQPTPELADFLSAGDPPVYIGFGSMSHRDPQKTLNLILEAVSQTSVRAMVASGWSGVQADSVPKNVLVIKGAPHDWLFPRMAAVVHHGGAGTTAAGLRAGRPTMIIPHMSDQPFWGRRVHELGVGVKSVPRHKLTSGALAAGIKQLIGDSSMLAKAIRLGELIRAENGVEAAVSAITIFAKG